MPFGEGHLRRTMAEYVEHYHRERNHQGLENELIESASAVEAPIGRIRRRQRAAAFSITTVAHVRRRADLFDGSAQQRDITRGSFLAVTRRRGVTSCVFGSRCHYWS